jgi:cytochrome c6
MKKQLLVTIATAILAITSSTAFAADGEALFKQHCAGCHPDGGNVINAKRTLHKKDLEQEGIKKWEDIVKYMRAPDPGMTVFDAKTIPAKDAQAIAEYVLKTFK